MARPIWTLGMPPVLHRRPAREEVRGPVQIRRGDLLGEWNRPRSLPANFEIHIEVEETGHAPTDPRA